MRKQKNSIPNFFIIGAAKSGTTTLYNYMLKHPEIYLSPVKEPQFFCHEGLFTKGIQYYLDTFYKGCEKYRARGETTPHYIYYEKVACRIAKLIPKDNQRFILIMRDPVARAYSLYWNMVYEGHEKLTFEEAIIAEKTRFKESALDERLGTIRFQYYDSGLYAKQIRQYFKYFDRDQFLFLFNQDLKNRRDSLMVSIFQFLGVKENVTIEDRQKYNLSGLPYSRTFHNFLRKPSWIKKQAGRFLPFSLKYKIVNRLLELNKKKFKYPPMQEKIEKRLRFMFKEDVNELEKITGRDLSAWLPV